MAKAKKPHKKAGPEKKNFSVSGQVIDSSNGRRAAKLRVEAWDKDLIFDDLVGSAVTDAQGAFRIEFTQSHFHELFLDRSPDLFFKVFDGDRLLRSTEDSVLWNAKSGDHTLTIEVEVPDIRPPDLPRSRLESDDPLLEEMLPRLGLSTEVATALKAAGLSSVHAIRRIGDLSKLAEQMRQFSDAPLVLKDAAIVHKSSLSSPEMLRRYLASTTCNLNSHVKRRQAEVKVAASFRSLRKLSALSQSRNAI